MNRGDRREPIFQDDTDRECTNGAAPAEGNDDVLELDRPSIAHGCGLACRQPPAQQVN
jgi:hypothetical protein